MKWNQRVSEYLSAASRAALAVEGQLKLEWEEYQYLEDTLVELLERLGGDPKVAAEEGARRADTE